MPALIGPRRNAVHSVKGLRLALTTGVTAHENGIACIDLDTGKLVPATTDPNLFPIGKFADVGNGRLGDGTTAVKVRLFKEIWCEWVANDVGGTPVDEGDIGALCYMLNDQTVTADDTSASVAGRVWGVSATKGVRVEYAMSMGPTGPTGPAGGG